MADEAKPKQAAEPGNVNEAVGMQKQILRDRTDKDIAASREERINVTKRPSRLRQLWQKAGLDLLTLKQMFKGSLPPTIAIAMYQASPVHDFYGTLGYIIAISAVLGFAILPRAKFIQTMLINIISVCVATAVNLLALFCVIKARQHTTPTDTPPDVVLYNASASAVAAIWLIVQIYFINSLKASRPQLLFPAILATIFVTVSLTYGVTFPDMPYAIKFMETLLDTFLTGFAIATGVSFLVFPLSSRTVLFMEMKGYLMLLNNSLKAQSAYIVSLETYDPTTLQHDRGYEEETHGVKDTGNGKTAHSNPPLQTPEMLKISALQGKIMELHGKLNQDIIPAKHEIAIGKINPYDLDELWKYMRRISLPVMGLQSMINVFEREAEVPRLSKENGSQEGLRNDQHRDLDNLHALAKELSGPVSTMVGNLDGVFNHILLALELVKPHKKKISDEERKEEDAQPGSRGFIEAYKKKVDESYALSQKTVARWCREHSIDLPNDFFKTSFVHPENLKDKKIDQRNQRSLFFVLYVEYLLRKISSSVLDLAEFADGLKRTGVLDRSKVIFPGSKAIVSWVKVACSREDFPEAQETSHLADQRAAAFTPDYLSNPDPEHLPPRNAFEKVGNKLRAIPRFLRSEDSVFGLRVVAATMTIGIVCYLEASQAFFLRNRLLWGMIMVAISMSKTSGQSVFNYSLRILGTLVAMVASYIAWYIVDGQTAGVIVFLWLGIFLSYYIVIKSPQLAIVGILTLVTEILIIAYELQVRAIGVAVATENTQPAYPIYELAPYRLAIVSGGLFVAFIWTVFPYPITESSQLRRDISTSLYLMSKYYSVVHETVGIRVQNVGGDEHVKGTHAYNLEKARSSIHSQLLTLFSASQMNAGFSKFQIQLGGRFPREEYNQLIKCIQRMVLWTSLASYASMTFQDSGSDSSNTSEWSSDFGQLLSNVTVTTASKRITSLLSLLSSSFSNAQPLPPYLEMPTAFEFVHRLESIDPNLLSVQHIAEPGYSAFAVIQIVSENINADIQLLVSIMKKLVGQIDFTYSATSAVTIDVEESLADAATDRGKVE